MRKIAGAGLIGASLVGIILHAQTSVTPTPADLSRRLQARYETVRDFSADFTQSYQGLLIRKATTERGKVLVKKPSRVRFTYTAPDKKEFVSDGAQFYSHYPKDRFGSVTPLPKGNQTSTALLFLAGQGDLVRDFTASLPAVQPEGEWHLQLVPRSKQADFNTLTLIVDRASLALRGFITVDDQGTNSIRFSNLKENTGLQDSAFLFKFPPGTEISR
jgi:outer membrane lipoprotein carrier protein